MELPGQPRAALGNSPARASKNRLGCATLVLQITPADQAARTAARTEHPSIPSPRPVSCYHWPGPRHGPMLVELPGRPRATAQHEPPGAHSDALHLFCISRLPTKQQARRHGRSILQLPAHCPPVANTAWAGNTDAGIAARTASGKSQVQAPRSRPGRAVHLQSTPADHVHTGPGRRAQAQPRQGGGSRSSTAGSRRQRTIARRGRRRRNHGLGQSGATLPTRVADQYLLTISYHEIPTSPTRCTWPSDCESAKAHRRNGPRRRSKGRRKAHREFSSTPRKGN